MPNKYPDMSLARTAVSRAKMKKKPLNVDVPVQSTIGVVASCFLYSASLNRSTLPSGVYKAVICQPAGFLPAFEPIDPSNDRPLEIDSAITNLVLEIKDFLGKRQMFADMGFSHKRGYLMHGPPGCGKTSALRLLEEEFIDNFDGVVLVWTPEAGAVTQYYDLIRKHESDRPIMLVVEDIDSCMDYFEENLLEFLDGQKGLQNFLLVATTNNLGQVPSRIKDRPSRIDRLIEIGKPSASARRQYLMNLGLTSVQIDQIASATDGYTVAQLKEVVVGHLLLGAPIAEVLGRIKVADMTPADVTEADEDDN